MLSVLIVCFTHLKRDPRVYRQLLWLTQYAQESGQPLQITAAGFSDPEIPGVSFIPITPFREKTVFEKLRQGFFLKCCPAEYAYWKMSHIQEAFAKTSTQTYDLVVANDIETVPLALKLNTRFGVVLDAHEYTPRQFDGQWTFRFFWQPFWEQICKTFLPQVKAMMTVCQGIADSYTAHYGVPCGVLTNAPFFQELQPQPVDDTAVRLVHHGLLKRARDLENLITIIDLLDERFTLDLILVTSDPGYDQRLRKMAAHNPRIRFVDPVPMPKIAEFLNQHYDMGLCLFPPLSSNYRFILPNKFFETIQARLAIATWPSQELVRFLNIIPCGVVSDDFSPHSLAEKLNALTKNDIVSLKQHAHHAAAQWNADTNKQIFLDAVKKALS